MRFAALVVALATVVLSGCNNLGPTNPIASQSTCGITYQSFSTELRLAAQLREEGDNVGALYHAQGANMNLDVLLARGCSRYQDTCPAMISL